MRKKLITFIKDEEGVVFVEYSLLAAMIALALVAVTIALREEIANIFTFLTNEFINAQN